MFLVFATIHQFIFSQTIIYVPKPVDVGIPQSVKAYRTLNSIVGDKSKVLIEVALPPGTVEWYFSFKTRRDKEGEAAMGNAIGLTTKIAALLTSSYTGGASVKFSGLAESAVKSIVITRGEVPINVYAFDLYNAQLFLNGDDRSRVLNGSYNVSKSHGNSIIKGYNTGTAYIGVDNPNLKTTVWVDVEVTAMVLEKKIINDPEHVQRNPNEPGYSKTYNKSEFIGTWKDENSTFTMANDGSFSLRFDTGKTLSGKWDLDENQLIFNLFNVQSNTYKKDIYKIIFWDGTNLRYQYIRNGIDSEVFNAKKISQ